MFKAYNRKGTELFQANSLEKAYEGLQKGTYKIGGYDVIEPTGKVHHFEKYVCSRKK